MCIRDRFISVSFHTHRLRKGTRLRAVIPALIVLLLLVAALAAVSGCALSGDGGTGGTDSTSATGREEVTLLSVADGDTITVRTAGGAAVTRKRTTRYRRQGGDKQQENNQGRDDGPQPGPLPESVCMERHRDKLPERGMRPQ